MKRILLHFLFVLVAYFGMNAEAIQPPETSDDSDFELAVSNAGGVVNDASDSKKIKLAEPTYGYVNFSGFEKMPATKTADLKGWMEFF